MKTVYDPPQSFGMVAARTTAHIRYITCRYEPRCLFVQAFLAQAAFIRSAGVAAERSSDDRLLIGGELLQVSFLAGVQRLKSGGAPLNEIVTPSMIAPPWYGSTVDQLHRNAHDLHHSRSIAFGTDSVL